jgi:hypothetical protein
MEGVPVRASERGAHGLLGPVESSADSRIRPSIQVSNRVRRGPETVGRPLMTFPAPSYPQMLGLFQAREGGRRRTTGHDPGTLLERRRSQPPRAGHALWLWRLLSSPRRRFHRHHRYRRRPG